MSDARENIITAACELLEQKGFHATSINDIVERSQAPKGSLYYYFPDGKDQIAVEAILAAGRRTAERIQVNLGGNEDLPAAIETFVDLIAEQMERSHYSAGSPLSVVAAETSSLDGPVNAACREAYQQLIQAVEDALSAKGFSASAAETWAERFITSIEGGILMGRAFHSKDPLEHIGKFLAEAIKEP